jgi:hypothetical protein
MCKEIALHSVCVVELCVGQQLDLPFFFLGNTGV